MNYLFISFLSAIESKILIPLEQSSNSLLTSTEFNLDNLINVFITQTVYIGNLSIGSPPKEFSFTFDIGSSWLWLSSINCKSCKHQNFNPSSSQTYSTGNKSTQIGYGDKYVEGILSTEQVSIGNKIVYPQDFVLANALRNFDDHPNDGMAGLAFPELSSNHDTLVMSMVKSGIIDSATFSLYLSDNDYGRKEEKHKSAIIFGGLDTETYAKGERVVMMNIIYSGYWSIPLSRWDINGEQVKLSTRIAILSSSINLLVGPPSDVLNIFSKIQKDVKCVLSQLLTCGCEDLDDFPVLELYLDAKRFYVNPEEYIARDGNTCYVLITSAKIGVWLLGNPFLRSYYSYYDMDKKTVGFARSSSASKLHPEKSLFWTIMLVILCITVLAIFLILGRYYYIKRRESRQRARREDVLIPLGPIK